MKNKTWVLLICTKKAIVLVQIRLNSCILLEICYKDVNKSLMWQVTCGKMIEFTGGDFVYEV